jgi:hypothetical protein
MENVFKIFEIAHMYQVHAVQSICLAYITKQHNSIDGSGDIPRQIQFICDVLNAWGHFYIDDESNISKGVKELMYSLIDNCMRVVLTNLYLWGRRDQEEQFKTLATCLSLDSMYMLLSSEGIEVDEKDLLKLLIQWIIIHYSDKTLEDHITEKDLEMPKLIRWGTINTEHLQKTLNTVRVEKDDQFCLPTKFRNLFEEILLDRFSADAQIKGSSKVTLKLKHECAKNIQKRRGSFSEESSSKKRKM